MRTSLYCEARLSKPSSDQIKKTTSLGLRNLNTFWRTFKSSPCIVTYLLHFNFGSIDVVISPVGVHVIFLAEKKRIGVSMFAQITLKLL